MQLMHILFEKKQLPKSVLGQRHRCCAHTFWAPVWCLRLKLKWFPMVGGGCYIGQKIKKPGIGQSNYRSAQKQACHIKLIDHPPWIPVVGWLSQGAVVLFGSVDVRNRSMRVMHADKNNKDMEGFVSSCAGMIPAGHEVARERPEIPIFLPCWAPRGRGLIYPNPKGTLILRGFNDEQAQRSRYAHSGRLCLRLLS
jgi:hypothetical protein